MCASRGSHAKPPHFTSRPQVQFDIDIPFPHPSHHPCNTPLPLLTRYLGIKFYPLYPTKQKSKYHNAPPTIQEASQARKSTSYPLPPSLPDNTRIVNVLFAYKLTHMPKPNQATTHISSDDNDDVISPPQRRRLAGPSSHQTQQRRQMQSQIVAPRHRDSDHEDDDNDEEGEEEDSRDQGLSSIAPLEKAGGVADEIGIL